MTLSPVILSITPILQINRIIERVEYISKMPTMGHRVHEFPELDLRETHQENYRITEGTFRTDHLPQWSKDAEVQRFDAP
jgi:hypothetical protein